MNSSDHVSVYTAFLAEEGFCPSVNEYGDVQFKFEGKTYVIDVDENDEEYFRVFVPNIFKIDDEVERARVLAAANHATEHTKAAKITLVGDYVWASLETFVASVDAFKPTFERSLRALQVAMHNFAKHLRDHAESVTRAAHGEPTLPGPSIRA